MKKKRKQDHKVEKLQEGCQQDNERVIHNARIIRKEGVRIVLANYDHKGKPIPDGGNYQRRWRKWDEIENHLMDGGPLCVMPGSWPGFACVVCDVDSGLYKNIRALQIPIAEYMTKSGGWHGWFADIRPYDLAGTRYSRYAQGCKFDLIARSGFVVLHDKGEALAQLLSDIETGRYAKPFLRDFILPDEILDAPTRKSNGSKNLSTKKSKSKGASKDASESRNCKTFNHLSKESHSLERVDQGKFEAALWGLGHAYNEREFINDPLDDKELKGIAKSVAKYQYSKERQKRIWTPAEQRNGGHEKARKGYIKTWKRDAQILAMREDGRSIKEIMAALDTRLSRQVIEKILKRKSREKEKILKRKKREKPLGDLSLTVAA